MNRKRSGLGPFVLRHLMQMPLVLGLAAFLVFIVFEQLADPAAMELGLGASPEALTKRQHQLGLDRPFVTRLLGYMRGLWNGDLGQSYQTGANVTQLLARGLFPSFSYAGFGLALVTLGTLTWALVLARKPGTRFDRLSRGVATLVMSSSALVVVGLVHNLLAHRLGLFPITWPLDASSRWWTEATVWHSLLLPGFTWALLQLGSDLRFYRALLRQSYAAPFVDGLRSRGLSEVQVARHVLRATAGGIIARTGHRFPQLFIGSVVIEEFFQIPGLGRLCVDALRHSDLPVMQGLCLLLATLTVGTQLVSELLAGHLDPRLRRW